MWCMVMWKGGGGGVELLTRDLSAEITESCNKFKKTLRSSSVVLV